MEKIKFSKEYVKLHGQKTAELVDVRRITIDDSTPKELIEYDTTATDGTKYKLGTGKYLQLIFVGDKGIPFCTIRSDKPAYGGMKSKADYYIERVHREFEIVRAFE